MVYSPDASSISILSKGSTKLSPNSFVFTEVNFQGKNSVVSSSITWETLMSRSFTKAGVGSFAIPLAISPATSVHDIDNFNGFSPSDLTFIINVSSFSNVNSFTTLAKPILFSVSAANFVFKRPHPVVASGPISDWVGEVELSGVMSSAVWRANPFRVAAFINEPYMLLWCCCNNNSEPITLGPDMEVPVYEP